MESTKKAEMNVEIQLDEETAQGTYINMAVVNHNESEFVLDFIFVQPQMPRGKVRSRIVTSPLHCKRLLRALEENLRNYEMTYGVIELAPVAAPPTGSRN